MTSLNKLGLYEAAEAIRQREVSAVELAEACIERIKQREPEVAAFESFDPRIALAAASKLDNSRPSGVLHGVPIGVKDIIDTIEYPCHWGSPVYAGREPVKDASCVAMSRAAGANIFGKTVTTEFAYFYPGKTKNPHNPAHTPGGSSMGSAAAVADYMLPFAFGSQTAASVTRPAAYCGVIGYKASWGSFDLQGVCGLAPSLDTLGFFTRDLRDIPLMRSVLCGDDDSFPVIDNGSELRIGFVRTPHWSLADANTQTLLENVATRLTQAGAVVDERELPRGFEKLAEIHNVIMAFETARARAGEYTQHRELLSDQFAALVENGLAISRKDYLNAKAAVTTAFGALSKMFGQYDVLIAPSATGEAPEGLGATGDPIFNRLWTVLHVPSITLPAGFGAKGLPLGVQVIAPFNDDNRLVAISDWIRRQL